MTNIINNIPSIGSYATPYELRVLAANCLRLAGMRDDESAVMAELLVFAQESEINSHGLVHLPAYISGITSGALNPRPTFHFHKSNYSSIAVLDADQSPGVLAGKVAADEAVRRATQTGVGVIAVHNSSHFGAASAFIDRIVSHDMVALVLSNASPTVAPRGSRTPMLGTNPIAAGFPCADGPPVIIDMATTAGARGAIRKAAANNETIPIHWALDKNGHPTTDANAALKGTMQSLGGAKGTGLGLMVELLCVALSGGATGMDTLAPQNPSDTPRAISHTFIAIDTKAVGGVELVAKKVAKIVNNIEISCPIRNDDPPRVPGTRSANCRIIARTKGILITENLAAALTLAAENALKICSSHKKKKA